MRLKVLLLINFFSFLGYSQILDKNYYLIDSLVRSEINSIDYEVITKGLKNFYASAADTSKIQALVNIVESCGDEKIWTKYNLYLLNLSNTLQNNASGRERVVFQNASASAINNIGYYFYNYTPLIDSAIYYYEKASLINEKNQAYDELIVCYSNIAHVYQNKGEIVKALEIYNKAVSYENKIRTNTGLVSALNNIASIYAYLGDTTSAILYLNKCFILTKQSKDTDLKSHLLQNIGILKIHRDFNSGLQSMKTALSIRRQSGNTRSVVSSLVSLSAVMTTKGDYGVAKQYLDEAKILLKDMNNPIQVILYHTNLGSYYEAIGQSDSALTNYQHAIDISIKTDYTSDLLRTLNYAIEICRNDPKYKVNKSKLFENYHTYSIQLNKSEALKVAARQQYENQLKIKEADFKVESEIKEAKVKADKEIQRNITITISLVLLLVLIFSFFIYKALKENKHKTEIINTQKQEVEFQKELIEEKQKEIIDSITYAKRIQNAYLPAEQSFNSVLRNGFLLFQPKDIVSGDFYWFYSLKQFGITKENSVIYAVADCTGHGVPGAIMSVICCNAINEAVITKKLYETNQILDSVRENVKLNLKTNLETESKDGMDIALCKINLDTNTLEYSGANNSLVYITNGAMHEIKADKQPIGNFSNEKPFTKHNIQLQQNDCIYIFSDGYADQFGGGIKEGLISNLGMGKKFKYAKLKSLLHEYHTKSMDEQKEIVYKTFVNWKGNLEQTDDVCMIGLKLA